MKNIFLSFLIFSIFNPLLCFGSHWEDQTTSADYMHIAGDEFLIDGVLADIGDEIGVFDSQGNIVGKFTVNVKGEYGDLAISGDVASTSAIDEGADNGENLYIKVYDVSEGREYYGNEIEYISGSQTLYYSPASIPLNYLKDGFFVLNIHVNPNNPPAANPGGPYDSYRRELITFDGSLSSHPQGFELVTYAWDFGDGNTGNGETYTHSYEALGTYTVSLTVSDENGKSSTATTTVAIVNRNPTAPTLLSPADTSTDIENPVAFQWFVSDDLDDDPIEYSLIFCEVETFEACEPTPITTPADNTNTTPDAESKLLDTSKTQNKHQKHFLLIVIILTGTFIIYFTCTVFRFHRVRYAFTSIILLLIIFIHMSCSDFYVDAPTRERTQVSLNLNLPDRLYLNQHRKPVEQGIKHSKIEITSMILSITGPGMDEMEKTIPLDTLEISEAIPSGLDRMFSVLITTEDGSSYQGNETVNLSPGESVDVTIDVDMPGDTVTIQGQLSTEPIQSKVSSKPSKHSEKKQEAAGLDWAKGTVKVITTSGILVVEVTPNSDGTYSVEAPEGSAIVLRASVGNLVLKTYLNDLDQSVADKVVTTDPVSTAVVMIISQLMGGTNFGEEGFDVNTLSVSFDLSKAVNLITDYTDKIAEIASAISDDIVNNFDPEASESSLGSMGTAGVSLIFSIASEINQMVAFMSHEVTELKELTTYYWKIIAEDDQDGYSESEVWSFTTKQNDS